jgi:hypothetical protein
MAPGWQFTPLNEGPGCPPQVRACTFAASASRVTRRDRRAGGPGSRCRWSKEVLFADRSVHCRAGGGQSAEAFRHGLGAADDGAYVAGVVRRAPRDRPRVAGVRLGQRFARWSRGARRCRKTGCSTGSVPGRRDRRPAPGFPSARLPCPRVAHPGSSRGCLGSREVRSHG